MTIIFVVMGFGLHTASSLADKFGLIAVLPLLPVIYLAAGFGFALVTILLKSLLLPRVPLNEPVKMFTPDFLKWWLVCRCIDLTNILVMKHFRGTVVLNYYFSLLASPLSLCSTLWPTPQSSMHLQALCHWLRADFLGE